MMKNLFFILFSVFVLAAPAFSEKASRGAIEKAAGFLSEGRIDLAAWTLEGRQTGHLGANAEESQCLIFALRGMRGLLKEELDDSCLSAEQRGHLFLLAARLGNIKAVKDYIETGADPDTQDKHYGETALQWAAAGRHEETAALLLENGADPDIPSGAGLTALHAAAGRGLARMTADFLKNGADPNIQAKDGRTALYYAAQSGARGHAETMALLLEEGADPNRQNKDGETALHWTAHHSDYAEAAALLLKHGADPNWKNKDGGTALRYALEEEHADIAALLLENGAGKP